MQMVHCMCFLNRNSRIVKSENFDVKLSEEAAFLLTKLWYGVCFSISFNFVTHLC